MNENLLLQSASVRDRMNEHSPVITEEDAKRQHDYHMAQVHFWRRVLNLEPLNTRSAQRRIVSELGRG